MRTIKIYCKICGSKLTTELSEFPETNLSWEDEEHIMPKNKFCILMNVQTNTKFLYVAIDDYNLKNHSDKSRFSGCCGSSAFNDLNMLCVNNHEVAIEVLDCCTSHYIAFDINKIIIKEKIDDHIFIRLRL